MLVLVVYLSACALFGPDSRDEYALTAVNGAPVPVTVRQGTLDGEPFDERYLSGKLVLFHGGSFAWELTTLTLINGEPDARYPQRTGRHTGAYDRVQDTLNLSWYFKAVRIDDDSWAIRDVSGFFGRSTYTVVRQR